MEALIAVQSRGMPVDVAIDGPAARPGKRARSSTTPGRPAGACLRESCHEENYGNYIRADHLSQGQINGFPTYRLKNAKLNGAHSALQGLRAGHPRRDLQARQDEFIALELYVASRGNGLSVEGPVGPQLNPGRPRRASEWAGFFFDLIHSHMRMCVMGQKTLPMISRRDFLQVSMAASALWGRRFRQLGAAGRAAGAEPGRAAAVRHLRQCQPDPHHRHPCAAEADLFPRTGGQYRRGRQQGRRAACHRGRVPPLYGIDDGSPSHYALTHDDFTALAQAYGKVGGLDRVATVVNAIRADRPDALLLDGGDTWHGSYTCYHTEGQDMVNVMNALKPDAMTFHWEFTLGSRSGCANWSRAALRGAGPEHLRRRCGTNRGRIRALQVLRAGRHKIAVIGQAFPYMPIANPGWMFPDYSFGIRDENMQEMVDEVRAQGAELVVCLSHNGFDVDKKMASVVTGIDVILTGHTHDALPEPVQVGDTILIASGSNGKFVSRVDLDVRDGRMMGFRHKLIPIFSDVIAPDPAMAA